jgi:hypothetical protein
LIRKCPGVYVFVKNECNTQLKLYKGQGVDADMANARTFVAAIEDVPIEIWNLDYSQRPDEWWGTDPEFEVPLVKNPDDYDTNVVEYAMYTLNKRRGAEEWTHSDEFPDAICVSWV